MRAIDFRGFRFGKIHTSDLHLEVVSASNRYAARVLPAPTDQTVDIPGSDGQYYFGSIYKNREISVDLAFDSVSEEDYRKIRQVFATDKLQDLVFDEEPYKTWRAKLKAKPDFKSLCFTDKETGERVYKGTGKLTFICYFPYAFGFDKYVVGAADYYMLNPPECIIQEAYSDETFIKNKKKKEFKELPQDTKYHYNLNPSDYEGGTTPEHIENELLRDKAHQNRQGRDWNPNDDTVWKSGFPTPEQVEAGELYFDTPQGEKTIIDVRGYWDNVPEWEGTAKLLTTPTLDFDQELMYLPQYSKTDYINMELGFNNARAMIGSRMLVYNPGDLPVDWEIRFDENKRAFWSCRGGTRFRIQRFNVERLPIPKAVDWCGLTTYEAADNDPYKYGNKYFKRRSFPISELIEAVNNEPNETFEEGGALHILKAYEDLTPEQQAEPFPQYYYTKKEIVDLLKEGIVIIDKFDHNNMKTNYYRKTDLSKVITIEEDYKIAFKVREWYLNKIAEIVTTKGLGLAHPHYCYYVEPIPRERLGHYIKLFYWQTIQWRGIPTKTGSWTMIDNWRDMLPDDFFTKKGTNGEWEIKDINNPLVNFLYMFADVKYNETTKKWVVNSEKYPDRITSFRKIYEDLDFEEGIAFANRYEEMYKDCITDMERFELYWDTLKRLLLKFTPMLRNIDGSITGEITEEYTQKLIDKFIDSYINHPSEFISYDCRDLNYNEVVFNGYKMPDWITEDYFEIDQDDLSGVAIIKEYLAAMEEDEDAIFTGKRIVYDRDTLVAKKKYSKLVKKLDSMLSDGAYLNDLLDDYYYLNSEERMLYTTANPYGMEFVYKPTKVLMNDAIKKGKWFKLPPGWSLITVEPVVDETLWGGKRWEDARPYDWGYGGDLDRNKREVQQLYDFVYDMARDEFLNIYPTDFDGISPENIQDWHGGTHDGRPGTEDDIDELLKFKIWYEKQIEIFTPGYIRPNETEEFKSETHNYFARTFFHKLRNDGEYQFLRIINSIWQLVSPYFKWTSEKGVYIDPDTNLPPQADDYDVCGYPLRCINGDISDWWWYACNYVWANFPPLYWAMADMLNRIQIKYIPLFY